MYFDVPVDKKHCFFRTDKRSKTTAACSSVSVSFCKHLVELRQFVLNAYQRRLLTVTVRWRKQNFAKRGANLEVWWGKSFAFRTKNGHYSTHCETKVMKKLIKKLC